MFAIVKTGGKQLKVSVDQKVCVEKIEANIGDTVVLDQVLMISEGDKVSLGAPVVAGAVVKAIVEDQFRTKKIIVFKKKRRQNYRRKNGHRQHQTVLRIVEIVLDGKSVKAEKPSKPKTEAEQAPKAAEKKVATKKSVTEDKA